MTAAVLEKRLRQAQGLLAEEDFAQALSRFSELTRLCPKLPAAWMGLAGAASALRQPDAAEEARRKVRELAPRNAKLLLQLGHQYQAGRQPATARACFEQAAEADPKDVNPLISLAVLSEKNHQIEESRGYVDRCLALDPGDEQARYLRALLDRREDKLDQAEARLRDLIASDPKHPYVVYAARYELAQILDRTGRYDEAMEVLATAKALVRKLADIDEVNLAYDTAMERGRKIQDQPGDMLRQLAKAFPLKQREPGPGLAFVGGHPRSGTTLTEQVLAAHPGIAALDEPHLFQSVLIPEFQRVRPLSSARLNVIRRLYIQALQREFGAESAGRLLLEKNPSLTAALPMWLRVFPDLQVIIVLRDPRDVAISCYFQNLPLNVANANFLSLERIAKHYAVLMEVWLAVRRWDGLNSVETRYEDMVADLAKEGRRVTEFLGLSWHEEQARFYDYSRAKRLFSPSYHDVTQPVSRRPVARWRNYEKHLVPILPLLQPYCQAFGYD